MRRCVVLDNVEDVLAAAGVVCGLLDLLPDLRVLVSSRLPLRVDPERVVALDGLDERSALALIARSVGQRGLQPALSGADGDALREIVRLLDRLRVDRCVRRGPRWPSGAAAIAACGAGLDARVARPVGPDAVRSDGRIRRTGGARRARARAVRGRGEHARGARAASASLRAARSRARWRAVAARACATTVRAGRGLPDLVCGSERPIWPPVPGSRTRARRCAALGECQPRPARAAGRRAECGDGHEFQCRGKRAVPRRLAARAP